MSDAKIPYPPSPADLPEGLTEYADSFKKQQNLLLAGLFVFLIFYVFMIVLFGMVGVWCFLTLGGKLPVLKIVGMVLCGTFFLFLIKGFFKGGGSDKDMHVEITAKEHPVLFGFIERLCEEINAPLPNKVYVSPDVNAACISRTSLINLFVEPKRDLLIGLGLVNCMNLSEFKAVLAHEFGHFCHLGHTSSYAVVVKRIIFDLVEGEDWFDRLVNWSKRQENVFSLFGIVVGACLWAGRKVLWWMLKTIALQDRAVSREQEFHADRVAVSAAGSDAATHGLLRARFGMQCFVQAVNDLATALDHKLYSNNLYLHQDRAAAVVRRKKKDSTLGLPPELPTPRAGAKVKVFDAEQDELEDNDDTPPMWRTHPADADREANAKEMFVAAPIDHRSPWMLFSDTDELKERLSYKFYRMVFRIPKNADLTAAKKVQEYIDNEHAETTYDPKYNGAYDDRPLEPGDLSELNGIIKDSPWSEERLEKVFDKLYEGCKEHAEAHSELHKELYALEERVVGKPSGKLKKQMQDVQDKLDENWEWFKSFDRRVYLLHVQMALQVDRELKSELVERYRFQLEVQRLYQESRHNFNKANAYLNALSNTSEPTQDLITEVLDVLRKAWKSLKNMMQDAREINLPALKNFEEGERLADFILEGKMVPEPPLSGVKGVWIDKLMTQLNGVKNRCFRLHFKSVGGILALQEKIAAAWVAARTPVSAEVIDFVASDEPVVAEVVSDEPERERTLDDVKVMSIRYDDPEEPVEAEVIEAEVLPVDEVEEVREPDHSPVAAFTVASPPPPIAPPIPSRAADVPLSLDADDVPDVVEEELPPPAPVNPTPSSRLVVPAATKPVPKPEPEPVEEPPPPVKPTVAAKLVTPAAIKAAPALTPTSFDLEPVPTEPAPPARVAPETKPALSLDADHAFAFGPEPEPPPPLPLLPVGPPAINMSDSAVSAAFSLDAAPHVPKATEEVFAQRGCKADEARREHSELFSLDADLATAATAPTPPAPKSAVGVPPAPPVAADDEFALVAEEHEEEATPEPEPAPRPAFGSQAAGPNGTDSSVEKPAEGRRPAVKITFVKPGMKSPFAK